jgi:hypothetical protein
VPKSQEDRIEDEVRRRLTSIAAAAGVDQGRIELEVLWMLPTEFVRMYRDLFDRCFVDPIKPQSDGGKDQGRVPAKSGSRSGVEGGAKSGKRWINPGWVVKSDEALRIKRNLDRRLVRAVEYSLRELRGTSEPRADQSRAQSIRAAGSLEPSTTPRCSECGQFLKAEWVRCPFHTSGP